jgi:hypothetical protein
MASELFARAIESFLTQVQPPAGLPAGVEVLNPYLSSEVRRVVHEMAVQFYVDAPARLSVWGINPGRFGAGLTGLSFTDPWAVAHQLGISTTLSGRRELSAEFISNVIDAYGGPTLFYRDIYLGAVSPLGFVSNGINVNFYDTPELLAAVVPYAIECMKAQLRCGLRTDTAVVLGSGKLRGAVERHINPSVGIGKIAYLEHPRFIMQYRRSQRLTFVDRYVEALRLLCQSNS